MTVETMVLTFGYPAIFFLMVINGVTGLPSSSLMYIFAGFLVGSGTLSLTLVILTGAAGNIAGNIALYELSRRKGVAYIARWRMFSDESIARLRRAFELRGSVIIFVGKLLSGVKVVIPVVAGVAEMNRAIYIIIISTSSLLWATGLSCFGLYLGRSYENNTLHAGGFVPIVLIAAAIVVFCRYVQRISMK